MRKAVVPKMAAFALVLSLAMFMVMALVPADVSAEVSTATVTAWTNPDPVVKGDLVTLGATVTIVGDPGLGYAQFEVTGGSFTWWKSVELLPYTNDTFQVSTGPASDFALYPGNYTLTVTLGTYTNGVFTPSSYSDSVVVQVFAEDPGTGGDEDTGGWSYPVWTAIKDLFGWDGGDSDTSDSGGILGAIGLFFAGVGGTLAMLFTPLGDFFKRLIPVFAVVGVVGLLLLATPMTMEASATVPLDTGVDVGVTFDTEAQELTPWADLNVTGTTATHVYFYITDLDGLVVYEHVEPLDTNITTNGTGRQVNGIVDDLLDGDYILGAELGTSDGENFTGLGILDTVAMTIEWPTVDGTSDWWGDLTGWFSDLFSTDTEGTEGGGLGTTLLCGLCCLLPIILIVLAFLGIISLPGLLKRFTGVFLVLAVLSALVLVTVGPMAMEAAATNMTDLEDTDDPNVNYDPCEDHLEEPLTTQVYNKVKCFFGSIGTGFTALFASVGGLALWRVFKPETFAQFFGKLIPVLAVMALVGTAMFVAVPGQVQAVGVTEPVPWYEPPEAEDLNLTWAYAPVGNLTANEPALNFTYSNVTHTFTSDMAIRIRNPTNNSHNILGVTTYLSPLMGTLEGAYYPLCYRANVSLYNQDGNLTQEGVLGVGGLPFALNGEDTGAAGQFMFVGLVLYPEVTEDHLANASLKAHWVLEVEANPTGELGDLGGDLNLGGDLGDIIIPPRPPIVQPMDVEVGLMPIEHYGQWDFSGFDMDLSMDIYGWSTNYTWGQNWTPLDGIPDWNYWFNDTEEPGTWDYFHYVTSSNLTYTFNIAGTGVSGVSLPNHYTVRVRDMDTGQSVLLREIVWDGSEGFHPWRVVATASDPNFYFAGRPGSVYDLTGWLAWEDFQVTNYTIANVLFDNLNGSLDQYDFTNELPMGAGACVLTPSNPAYFDPADLPLGNYTLQVTGSYWDPVTDTFLSQPDHLVYTTYMEVVEPGVYYPNGTLIPEVPEDEDDTLDTTDTNVTEDHLATYWDQFNTWAETNGSGAALLLSGLAFAVILIRTRRVRRRRGGVF